MGRYAGELIGDLSPADLFERQWAGTVLDEVLATLRRELAVSGRLGLFEALEPHLWGDDTSTPYARISDALNMTAVAVRVTLHRLRQRFHELLRCQIAHTIDPRLTWRTNCAICDASWQDKMVRFAYRAPFAGTMLPRAQRDEHISAQLRLL